MAADVTLTGSRRRDTAEVSSGRGPKRLRTGLGSWRMAWFLLPATVLLFVLAVWPLITLVRMSLSDVQPSHVMGNWQFVGFDNFGPVLTSSEFWGSALTTLWFTLLVLVVNLVGGFLAALALASPSRDAKFVQTFMIFVWAMPLVVVGNIWKFLFNERGVVNTALNWFGVEPIGWLSNPSLATWSIAIVASWASLPFSVVMIRAALMGIPQDVLDAASVDGAGRWQARWYVILPQLRPTLLVITVLTLMYGFRSFDYVYVLTKGGPGTSSATLPFLAYRDAFTRFDFSEGATVAVLSMIIVVALGLGYLRAARKELSA